MIVGLWVGVLGVLESVGSRGQGRVMDEGGVRNETTGRSVQTRGRVRSGDGPPTSRVEGGHFRDEPGVVPRGGFHSRTPPVGGR